MPKIKKAEITLEYQNYCPTDVVTPDALITQASMNDRPTITKFGPMWMDNIKKNHEKFGPFKDRSVGQFFNLFKHKPGICVGSGPSLKKNIAELKSANGMAIVSCLHNFHAMIDNEIDVDFYVTLDGGEVTVEEVYEGGKEKEEFYWSQTKGKKLLAYIGSNTKLLEKWQGEIYFFNCPVPDENFIIEQEKLEKFRLLVSSGGNVLGACVYLAKAILGCNPIVFLGADFSFSYDKKFHGWDSKYDKEIGQCIHVPDVFGNKTLTWQSYFNFKTWFEWMSLRIPGIYYNCTEGGILGSYAQGNIFSIIQMDLCDFLNTYNLHEAEPWVTAVNDPTVDYRQVLY